MPDLPVFILTAPRLETNALADRPRQRSGWTQRDRPPRHQAHGPSGFPAAPRLETPALAGRHRQHSGWKQCDRLPQQQTPVSQALQQSCVQCKCRGHALRQPLPARNRDCHSFSKSGHVSVAYRSPVPKSGHSDCRHRQQSPNCRRHGFQTVDTDLAAEARLAVLVC